MKQTSGYPAEFMALFANADPHMREATQYMWLAYCLGEIVQRRKGAPGEPFQEGVERWMPACFTPKICADIVERIDRFWEECFELGQACGGTADRAHALVDYTFARPIGEKRQEVGGVMVTLAALCLTQGIDMHAAGDAELARVWTKIDQIRAKQASKPTGSALPVAWKRRVVDEIDAERHRQMSVEGYSLEHDDGHPGEMARAAAAYAFIAGLSTYLRDQHAAAVHNEEITRDGYFASAISLIWPWDSEGFKPKDPRRDLIRAGALIVAEIERLDRESAAQKESGR